MRVVKIMDSIYVDGVLQDVMKIHSVESEWFYSEVGQKAYLFLSDGVRYSENGESFLIKVIESNIPKDQMIDGEYVHGNSLLARNMRFATQKEINDLLKKEEEESEFKLDLNCNFSNGNSSFGFQAAGNLSREKMKQFQDDLKELCNKYKSEE